MANRLYVRLNRRSSVVVAVLIAVLAVVGTLIFTGRSGLSDDTQIQQLVQKFANAADHQDAKEIVTQLCEVEAAGFTDSDAASSTPAASPERVFLTTSTFDIQIAGDFASAKVTRSEKNLIAKSFSTTLYFHKENGTWKVCNSAAIQFSQYRKGSS